MGLTPTASLLLPTPCSSTTSPPLSALPPLCAPSTHPSTSQTHLLCFFPLYGNSASTPSLHLSAPAVPSSPLAAPLLRPPAPPCVPPKAVDTGLVDAQQCLVLSEMKCLLIFLGCQLDLIPPSFAQALANATFCTEVRKGRGRRDAEGNMVLVSMFIMYQGKEGGGRICLRRSFCECECDAGCKAMASDRASKKAKHAKREGGGNKAVRRVRQRCLSHGHGVSKGRVGGTMRVQQCFAVCQVPPSSASASTASPPSHHLSPLQVLGQQRLAVRQVP